MIVDSLLSAGAIAAAGASLVILFSGIQGMQNWRDKRKTRHSKRRVEITIGNPEGASGGELRHLRSVNPQFQDCYSLAFIEAGTSVVSVIFFTNLALVQEAVDQWLSGEPMENVLQGMIQAAEGSGPEEFE
jgi:hypothetical protein